VSSCCWIFSKSLCCCARGAGRLFGTAYTSSVLAATTASPFCKRRRQLSTRSQQPQRVSAITQRVNAKKVKFRHFFRLLRFFLIKLQKFSVIVQSLTNFHSITQVLCHAGVQCCSKLRHGPTERNPDAACFTRSQLPENATLPLHTFPHELCKVWSVNNFAVLHCAVKDRSELTLNERWIVGTRRPQAWVTLKTLTSWTRRPTVTVCCVLVPVMNFLQAYKRSKVSIGKISTSDS